MKREARKQQIGLLAELLFPEKRPNIQIHRQQTEKAQLVSVCGPSVIRQNTDRTHSTHTTQQHGTQLAYLNLKQITFYLLLNIHFPMSIIP